MRLNLNDPFPELKSMKFGLISPVVQFSMKPYRPSKMKILHRHFR